MEVVGIPQSVSANYLEKAFSKTLEKVVIEVPSKDIDTCRRVVRFLKRKDCQQILSEKKDVQMITVIDLDLPNTNNKLHLNESHCLYYCILWSKSKALFTMGKISSYFFSNGPVKINLQEQGPSIQIAHTADLEKYFPGVDLSNPR